MATLNDVPVIMTSFTDIYATSSVAVGTKLLIQNKSSQTVIVKNVATQPLDNDWNGFLIPSYSVWTVEAGSVGCWIKGNGFVAVESY